MQVSSDRPDSDGSRSGRRKSTREKFVRPRVSFWHTRSCKGRRGMLWSCCRICRTTGTSSGLKLWASSSAPSDARRPAAVRLLGALFGDGSPDAVPPQMKQRSSIGDLGPRRPRDERTSGADADEQDLENFDVDGSLSADDVAQVKMHNFVRQLVAANPAWAPMFS
mmetsp:Transcript_17239/g.41775  ORF Transcript_17239/g.41775 Transcript_17239/m.41775 type:complete len:166 (+) Transcript_17239:984-1481(+)